MLYVLSCPLTQAVSRHQLLVIHLSAVVPVSVLMPHLTCYILFTLDIASFYSLGIFMQYHASPPDPKFYILWLVVLQKVN